MYHMRKNRIGLALGLMLICLLLAGACTTTHEDKPLTPLADAGAAPSAAEPTEELTLQPTAEPEADPTADPTTEPTAEPLDVNAIAAPVFEAMQDKLIHEGYLLDMDGDGVEEIITRSGSCEADAELAVYVCEAGGARLVGTLSGSNSQVLAHVNGGMVVHYGHMGVEQVDLVTLENGALHTTTLIAQQEVAEYTESPDWTPLEPCA
ncbi:MAG: PT domain-containing protein [bacterium]|nr:PT domain-containing protein [bacterium]